MLNLAGKKIWSNGDSIMSPTDSWLNQLIVAAGGSLSNYTTVANGGKGFTNAFTGQYSPVAEIPSGAAFDIAFLNITANDIQQGTTWVAYGEYMDLYLAHMINVKGWAPGKIVFSNPYWRSPQAGDIDPAAVYTPTLFTDYNREIRRLCGKYGVVYGDPYGYVDARPELQPYFGSLHPSDQGNPSGHTILRDYYLSVQDYTPATPVVEDPQVRRRGYTFTATQATNLASLNLGIYDVALIYETANPLNFYAPARSGLPLTTLTPGTRYTIVPIYKVALNLNALGLPGPDARPSTFSGTAEAQAYASASGRGSSQSALAAFVATLKQRDLWDRCLGFWLLDGSYNAAKYNLKNPQDSDAAGRLIQVGGSFGSGGWTGGGGNSALRTGLFVANSNHSAVFYAGTDNATISTNPDIGGAESYLTINYDGRMVGRWNAAGGYAVNRGAQTRFYINGDNAHQMTWVGERTANKHYGVGNPPSNGGEFTIGNAAGLNQGSTRTFRSAGYFTGLEDDEVIYLDRAIAALEAGQTTAPPTASRSAISLLSLPDVPAGSRPSAAYVNALNGKINEVVELVNYLTT
jgi:hypothetical protein